MRLTLDLPHLKPATATANAKYRRRVPDDLRSIFGKRAVEWSLGTKDPKEIFKAWEIAHARFEAMAERGAQVSSSQLQWEMVLKAAIEHGLAGPRDTQIGPVDFEAENGRYMAFAQAALAEGAKLSPQQMNAKFANKPAPTASDLLLEAQVRGIERPPVTLADAAENYLKDREDRSTFRDLLKQVNLVRKGIVGIVGEENPKLETITFEHAYAYRDSLKEKGNAISSIDRRMTTVNAMLNHAKKRFRLTHWENPFLGIELPKDDGAAGIAKRMSLSFEDIRKTVGHLERINSDASDIWLLMMFTGAGPFEIQGLLWEEVHLEHDVPHFEIKANSARRLKASERPRRIPLVGAGLQMMKERAFKSYETDGAVFPRYASKQSAGAVSAVMVKMMKSAGIWIKIKKVPYSLRHSLKDHLRRVAPMNFQLLIFGHGHGEGGSASGYGEDDLLDMQAAYLKEALELFGVFEYPNLKTQSPRIGRKNWGQKSETPF